MTSGVTVKRVKRTVHFKVRLFLILFNINLLLPLRIDLILIGESSTPSQP